LLLAWLNLCTRQVPSQFSKLQFNFE
jgi:hypothetical protein